MTVIGDLRGLGDQEWESEVMGNGNLEWAIWGFENNACWAARRHGKLRDRVAMRVLARFSGDDVGGWGGVRDRSSVLVPGWSPLVPQVQVLEQGPHDRVRALKRAC